MKKILGMAFAVILTVALSLFSSAEAMPGINILTGGENPLTFDEHTVLPSFVSNAVLCQTPMENEDGNAILHYLENPSGDYAAIGFSFNPALDPTRAYQISFSIYQKADEGFGKHKNLWIMKNGMAGWQRAQNVGGLVPNYSDGWLEFSYLVDTFSTLVNTSTNKVDTSNVSKILFEWRYDSATSACTNQKIYLDNVSVTPAYLVTYVDEDGKTLRSVYENLSGASYSPSLSSEDKDKGIIGWSKENDGTADIKIPLENRDFTLYAVYDNTLYFGLESSSNMLTEKNASSTITSSLYHRKGVEGITVSYSCDDGFVNITDNGDGTATVKSLSEGLAKIICTASTGESDEIYILSSYQEEYDVMKIVKSVAEIKSDAHSETAVAVLFTTMEKNTKIRWKSSSDCVAVSSSGDGKATLTPVRNGSATITAYIEGHEDICDSFDITISGQREKEKVYELNVLVWGASLAKHPPAESLYWYGNWGMAASSEEKDFIHRLVYYLEKEYYPSRVNLKILAESGFDTSINNDTSATTDYRDNQYFLNMENAVKEFNPNIIVTLRTGNLSNDVGVDIAYNAYSQLYDMVYSYVPDAIVVAHHCLLHHDSMKEELYKRLDERYPDKIFETHDLDVHSDEDNLAREWLELGQGAVANHWNDKGHDEVARITMQYLDKHIPQVLTPSFVYRPKEIKITGKNKISEKGGAVQLYAYAYPENSSNSVIWSVDNQKVATVNKNGLVTAVNNGTVTVTATSSFDEDVYSQYEIYVSGQPETYSVIYLKNTDDNVSGMPENDGYAKGEYMLSELIPQREYYTFIGWGLTEDAVVPVKILNVNEDKTLYAIWKKTDGFEFEGSYTEDKGFTYGFEIDGGFHNEIKDSCLFTVCTLGERVRFRSPKLDITGKSFISFGLSCGYADDNSKIELLIKASDGEKLFVYPLTSTKYTTYVADVSSLGGSITGFEIYVDSVPADSSMYNIALDFVRFLPISSLECKNSSFKITDGNCFVSSDKLDQGVQINTDGKTALVTLEGGYSCELFGADSIYIDAENIGSSISVNIYEKDFRGNYEVSVTTVYTKTDDVLCVNGELSEILAGYGNGALRILEPHGVRVKASIQKSVFDNARIEEYGFAVAKKDTITNGSVKDVIISDEYVLSGKVVYGKAYSRSENIHKTFDSDGLTEYFTAVLINIPKTKKAFTTPLVFRPYIRLSDGSIVYGCKTQTSVSEIAARLYYSSDTDEETKLFAKQILDVCEYEKGSVFLPLDDLWQ